MGRFIYFLYNIFFIPVFVIGFRIASSFSEKVKLRRKEEKRCRKECYQKYKKKVKERRILFHCSSLGEWEQAAPLVEIIKKNNPYLSVIVSFFSYSGYNYLKDNPDINGKIYLPLDSYKRALLFFNAIKPDLWIISAYDIWPNHIMAAKKLNIPIVVISATLAESSGRHKGLSKYLNRYIFKNINSIYSRSSDDTKRFKLIYPYPEKILTYGDTRTDRVYEKSINIKKDRDITIFKNINHGDIVFIAGSTWPADEKVVLPGLISLLEKYSFFKVIIVPHEIDDTHISSIERMLLKNNIPCDRYTSLDKESGSEKRVVIVNAIGILAKLYKNTHIAYIGGSFGKGVHNVLEPTVFGMPVLFGPNYINSQEAISLKDLGVTFSVKNVHDFITEADKLISDNTYRENCNAKALGYIRNNLGASGKIYQNLIKRFDFIQ